MIVCRRVAVGFGLALLMIAGEAVAQTQTYRWIDEQGNPHYVGRRDQVPERYRSQLPPEGANEPPRPRLPSSKPSGIASKVTGECVLRVRGNEQHRGYSSSYPSCEACWKALDKMRGEAKSRAECLASSVKSYR
jgi:hypothetical protein